MPVSLVPPEADVGRPDVSVPRSVCSWTSDGQYTAWVRMAGELDMVTTPQLARTLTDCQLQAPLVVLDLHELVFMDSTVVHAIVDASIRARAADRRLVLLRGPRNVDRVFALTGTADDIEIGDLRPVEPAVQVLLQIADWDRAS
jgi:anti-anti-sigma factor